jgi:hypothetical protein
MRELADRSAFGMDPGCCDARSHPGGQSLSAVRHSQARLIGLSRRLRDHAAYSFGFAIDATLGERSRSCSSSSGTRLIGPCTIGRARLVARRTRRRYSSSISGIPKTRKTMIANKNHPLIESLSLRQVMRKKPRNIRRGLELCGSRLAGAGQPPGNRACLADPRARR